MNNNAVNRRQLLSAALYAGGVAAATPQASANVAPCAAMSQFPPPPEGRIINSKEYGKKRIRKFQEGVQRAGLDALIISNRGMSYISYVSNYHPSAMQPGVILVPAKGDPTLYMQMYSSAHARMAKRSLWIDDLVDVPRDPVSESSSENFYKAIVQALKDRKLERGRIGVAGGEVDWLLPSYFQSQLPNVRVEDANPLVWSLIIVRDDVELALMRYTSRISDQVAVPLIKSMLTPGTLDKDIFTEVLHAMMRAGADQSRLILGAAPYSDGIWATPAQNRRVEKGDIVLCEPIVTFGGYQTERMFTFAVGKPSEIPDSQKRGAQVIYESFQLAMQEMKPGRELREVYEKANNYIKSKGYPEGSTVLIGHFIGVDNHEGPRITSEGTKGLILQPNMVISWHPNVVVPGEGGVRTICSDSLLITNKGAEMMSKLPMEPIVYVG